MMSYVLVVILSVFGGGHDALETIKIEMSNLATCERGSKVIIDDMKKDPINPSIHVKTYCLPIQ
jgi:hypothetical protein